MAWVGPTHAVEHHLELAGADRGADGRFIIAGEDVTGDSAEILVSDATVYFVRGRPQGLARDLVAAPARRSGPRHRGRPLAEHRLRARQANPIPKGQHKAVREATKRFERELRKSLKDEVYSVRVRDEMPEYTVVVQIETCPGSGDVDRREGDVMEAFRASKLDRHLYFDGTDFGPVPGAAATPADRAMMGCPERGYHFYEAGPRHPPGENMAGFEQARAWERACIAQATANPAPESGPTRVVGGVPMRMAPGLDVAWSPVNQAYIVTWNDHVLRVLNDPRQTRDYLGQVGALRVNPLGNPARERHLRAYESYIRSANRHLTAGVELLEQGKNRQAFAALRHAECDVRQAYTEASYGKQDADHLKKLGDRLEPLYNQLRGAMDQLEAQL